MARRQRKGFLAEINVVPYIDVMLVLLVIFMITTPLLSQGVKVNLPQGKANAISAKDDIPLVVSVDAAGKFYLNAAQNPDVPLTPEHLATQVAAFVQLAKSQGKTRLVLVKGDKDVDYGRVVSAMVLLQHVGVDNVGLMTKDISDTQA